MKIITKVTLGIFVCVILLGIVGTIVYFSRVPKQDTNTSPTPTPTSTPTASPSPQPTATPQPIKNITISYSTDTKQSITFSTTYPPAQPFSGHLYFEAHMIITNNGYDNFSTDLLYFYAMADYVKYSIDPITWNVNNNYDFHTDNVLNGETFKMTLVFNIPESASSFTVGYSPSGYNIIWTKT
jgi:hypothetical protein